MKCPECNKEMAYKKEFKLEQFYHSEDECYYYDYFNYEVYNCKNCNISNRNGKWQIPDNLLPSDKQAKAVNAICGTLGFNYVLTTKNNALHFIEKHIERSKKVAEENRERDAWDNADWDYHEQHF